MKSSVFLVLFFLMNSHAEAAAESNSGGWSGNGGEPQRMAENVWFLGTESVPYCVLASDDYPIGREQLRVLVKESFAQWFDFFNSYGIDGTSRTFKAGTPPPPPPPVPPLAPPASNSAPITMANHFVEVDCAANNPPFTVEKLRFQFGISNSMLDAYRSFNPEEPLGAAMKRSADGTGLNTYGYVWLDQFSPDLPRVQHLLLHEIGHVLGMAHNSVYVMNQGVVDDIRDTLDGLGAIESTFWPYRLRKDTSTDLSLNGFVKPRLASPDPSLCNRPDPVANGLFRELKLKPQDCFNVDLKTKMIDAQRIQLALEISGASQTITLNGEFKPFPLTDLLPKGPKFQTLLADKTKWVSYVFDPAAVLDSWQGDFTTADGRSIAAQLFMVKGIVVHLHLPSMNDWVMLRSNGK